VGILLPLIAEGSDHRPAQMILLGESDPFCESF
jgi:hypothetical protein